MMTFDYDGDSLPMIRIKKPYPETEPVYRVQKRVYDEWQTLATEDEYWKFIDEFYDED